MSLQVWARTVQRGSPYRGHSRSFEFECQGARRPLPAPVALKTFCHAVPLLRSTCERHSCARRSVCRFVLLVRAIPLNCTNLLLAQCVRVDKALKNINNCSLCQTFASKFNESLLNIKPRVLLCVFGLFLFYEAVCCVC